jgi:protein-L-isoaspartate O-methyltransferase
MRAITFILFLTSACSCLAQQKFNTDSLAPYIPSPQVVVDRMLEAARVRPGETVYDLGSGDGRIVITAAQKFKAYAVGVEISHDLCSATTAKVKSLGLEDKIKIVQGNALRVDLSPADVVTLYLLTSSNEKLKPNLEKYLKPGSRVVSHDFEFRGWTPVDTVKVSSDGHTHTIFVYEMAGRKP